MATTIPNWLVKANLKEVSNSSHSLAICTSSSSLSSSNITPPPKVEEETIKRRTMFPVSAASALLPGSILSHSRFDAAQRFLWLLLMSTLHQELSGGSLAWAAITGVGLAVPSTPLQIQKATLGSVQPVRTVELTQRNCELNALSRVLDDTYCDKYYVCSDGKYVGLFCPIGMAFDYGLQECRFKHRVDCSKRPLIFGESLLPGVTTSTMMPETTTTPTPQWTTTTTSTPGRMTSPPIIDSHPAGQHTHGNVMTLPFGAKVTIPFGSTIFLPPGTRVEMQQLTPSIPAAPPSHSHSHSHHNHRSSSSAIDVMNDPVNMETRSTVDNIDPDYYFDDGGAVDPGFVGGE